MTLDSKKQEELFDRIKNIGIPFGSRAFGCELKQYSDYDFIVKDTFVDSLINLLNKYNYPYKEMCEKIKESSGEYEYIPNNKLYNTYNMKFVLNKKEINLISYTDDKYDKVSDIIENIHSLLNIENSVTKSFKENKEARILIINGFFNAMFMDFNTANNRNDEDSLADIDIDDIPF